MVVEFCEGIAIVFLCLFEMFIIIDLLQSFVAGYTVTVLAGLVSYPLDTIRRRMMVSGESATEAFENIGEEKGVGGYWQGAFMNVLRGLTGSLTLVVFDMVKESYLQVRA